MLEDIIVEAIQICGVDCFYIPRVSGFDYRALLGDQPDTRFAGAYPIEMYIINAEGYDGENAFVNKFGWNFRSSSNFAMSARSFQQFIGQPTGLTRPMEGDLIYVPMLRRLFEIQTADPDQNFHAIGKSAARPYYWELRVQAFKFAQENIQTGVADIDGIELLNSYTLELQLTGNSTNYIIGEEVYQGNTYMTNTCSAKVVDWNPTNKLLHIIDINGTMNVSSNVVGLDSGSSYVLTAFDEFDNVAPDVQSDNHNVDQEADTFMINLEDNPLGGNV
jgi:hypothetical protein